MKCHISFRVGVFGSGKSYLLAVVVKFLVELFEKNESYVTRAQEPSKILISSMTNVAVDGILKRCVIFFLPLSLIFVLFPEDFVKRTIIFTLVQSTMNLFYRTRMHSSRMRTACSSTVTVGGGGWGVSVTDSDPTPDRDLLDRHPLDRDPPPVDRKTLVKIFPLPKLHWGR